VRSHPSKDDAPDDAQAISVVVSENSGSFVLENNLSLVDFERTERSVKLSFPIRGFYQLSPVQYLSSDLHTLVTVEGRHRYLDTVVVYPRVWSLEELELLASVGWNTIPGRLRRKYWLDWKRQRCRSR